MKEKGKNRDSKPVTTVPSSCTTSQAGGSIASASSKTVTGEG